MKTIVLDTNSLIRYLLDDVPDQANQVGLLLNKAKKNEIGIFIPQIVVFEIEFALSKYYKFSKAEVVDKLGTIIVTPYLRIQDGEKFQQAILIYGERNIDFVDCFLLCSARLSNYELFTFDKELKSLYKSLGGLE